MLPEGIRPRTTPLPTPAPTPTATPTPTPTPAPNTLAYPVDGFDPAAGPSATPPAVPARATTPAEAQDNVDAARAELEETGEAARKKEEELQTTLARVGPGLTPEQINDLRDSFRAENSEIYEAEEAAAAELAEALQDPALDEATRLEGYQELAKSPSHAEEALQYAQSVAEADPTRGASDEIQDLAATALENALPSIMANSPDAETALADLETYLAPLVRAGGGAKGVKEAYEALQATRAGNYDLLGSLADKWDSKLSRSIGIAAVAIGAASAVGSVREGDYLKAIESLGGAGSKGIELLVGWSQSASRVTTGATSAAGALGTAALRFSGALAAVAGAAGFAQDLKAFLDGKGEGYAVAAVGDLIAVAGGVVLATGLGAPLGALLIAIGTVVSSIGRIWGAQTEREKIGDELQQQLERAGIPSDLAELYGKNFEEVGALGHAGFSPEEIQEIIQGEDFEKYDDNVDQLVLLAESGMSKEDIEAFVDDNTEAFQEKRHIEAFLGFAQSAGLEPAEFVEFADKLRESDSGGDWGIELAHLYESAVGPDGTENEGTLDARLRSILENVFPDAHDLAVEKSPEIYGEDGQKIQEAQLDVDTLFAVATTQLDLSFAQLIADHDDDPEYLEAMVEYVRQEYGEEFLDIARSGLEIYEEDSLGAFDEAVEATE